MKIQKKLLQYLIYTLTVRKVRRVAGETLSNIGKLAEVDHPREDVANSKAETLCGILWTFIFPNVQISFLLQKNRANRNKAQIDMSVYHVPKVKARWGRKLHMKTSLQETTSEWNE